MQLESLSEWVEPMYLDVGVQKQIQQQFEEDSQIQLPNFLLVSWIAIFQQPLLVCVEVGNCECLVVRRGW